MSIRPGKYTAGSDTGTLRMRTGRSGAAAKAGHDLVIEVTAWQATLELAEDPAASRLELSADSGSFVVREGTGGIQALDDEDKVTVKQTIDDEILKGTAIAFGSHEVQPAGDGVTVRGELELLGRREPLTFELALGDDGRVTGCATVRQTAWGIKPYSSLFGTLRVADAVEVTVDAALQPA